MVKEKKHFVVISFILSTIGVCFQLVAICTDEWILAGACMNHECFSEPEIKAIHYGLFNGALPYHGTRFQISITCLKDENICAYVCGRNSTIRIEILQKLRMRRFVEFDLNCPKVGELFDGYVHHEKDANITIKSENYEFINYRQYAVSIAFFIISLMFGLIASLMTVWNTVTTPRYFFLNITGIHFYNATSIVALTVGITLYTILYGDILIRNICIQTTITGEMNTKGLAYLGLSFWINMASLVLYIVSDQLLYVRNSFIDTCEVTSIRRI